MVGCTGVGLTSNGIEEESGSGFSLLAVDAPEALFDVIPLKESTLEGSSGASTWKKIAGAIEPRAWISLANPFLFDVETWLGEWNKAFPNVPCVGGLASGEEETTAVFWNDRIVDALVLGVRGMRVLPLVSQGCRPIGEPLTVTKAENNIVYALGSHPAYEALESAFEG